MEHVHSSAHAFAAIQRNGIVITWGNALFGGDSSAVRDQLKDVVSVDGFARAFAALRTDGAVITWGDMDCGGDMSELAPVRSSLWTPGNRQQAFVHLRALAECLCWIPPLPVILGVASQVHAT